MFVIYFDYFFWVHVIYIDVGKIYYIRFMLIVLFVYFVKEVKCGNWDKCYSMVLIYMRLFF